MDMRVFDFYVSSRIREQDAPVRLRRRNVDVAEIRAAPGIKIYPDFHSLDLQIFQVDIATQVQRVEIFNPHLGQHAADFPKLLARLRIIELEAN